MSQNISLTVYFKKCAIDKYAFDPISWEPHYICTVLIAKWGLDKPLVHMLEFEREVLQGEFDFRDGSKNYRGNNWRQTGRPGAQESNLWGHDIGLIDLLITNHLTKRNFFTVMANIGEPISNIRHMTTLRIHLRRLQATWMNAKILCQKNLFIMDWFWTKKGWILS